MKRSLSLHQLTVIELAPLDFVDLAAAIGCQGVCVFAHWPKGMPVGLPTIPREIKTELLSRLADHGLKVSGADFFPVSADLDLADYQPSMAFAAELGVRHLTSAIQDEDRSRAVDRLGALADLAAAEGLKVGVEFMGMTPACDTLQSAAWFVDQVARPNLGITVDALHLVRGGGTAAEVAKLDPRYFNNAQICDGHGLQRTADYVQEAAMDREKPGAGDFPLDDIFSAIPADVPVDLEMPSMKRAGSGVSTREFVGDAISRAREILGRVTPSR